MNKYGPGRGELLFRLLCGLGGLVLLAGVLAYQGMPSGPAFFELFIIGGGFFGGTAVWSAWKLWNKDHP